MLFLKFKEKHSVFRSGDVSVIYLQLSILVCFFENQIPTFPQASLLTKPTHVVFEFCFANSLHKLLFHCSKAERNETAIYRSDFLRRKGDSYFAVRCAIYRLQVDKQSLRFFNLSNFQKPIIVQTCTIFLFCQPGSLEENFLKGQLHDYEKPTRFEFFHHPGGAFLRVEK